MGAAALRNRGPDRVIRGLSEHDEGLIRDSWKKSFRDMRRKHVEGIADCNEVLQWVPDRVYYHCVYGRINALLERARFLVLAQEDDPEHVYGWICYEPGVAHYVYIKTPFRRMGFARELVEAAGLDPATMCITHWTRVLEYIPHLFRFKPSLLGEFRTVR